MKVMKTTMKSKINKRFRRWMSSGIRLSTGGSMSWEETGRFQLDFLISQGMLSTHCLLDIGCSVLRGGVHFIKYLDKGRYFGFDKEEELIHFAKSEIILKYKLTEKEPQICLVQNFDLPFSDVKFDYMFAQSVFSHLSPSGVRSCFEKIICPFLKDDGKFYATYHEGNAVDIGDPHGWRTTGDERVRVEYPFSFFEQISEDFKIKASALGNWVHEQWTEGDPNKNEAQKMLMFQKSG